MSSFSGSSSPALSSSSDEDLPLQPYAPPPVKVIIIGAGVSGLSVAHHLAQESGRNGREFQVTILEARDHIGGRTHTVPFGKTNVDLGGYWMHSIPTNPLRELAGKMGLEFGALELPDDRIPVADDLGQDHTEIFKWVNDEFWAILSRVDKASHNLDAAHKVPRDDDTNVAHFIRGDVERLKQRLVEEKNVDPTTARRLVQLGQSWHEGFFAAPLSHMSFFNWDDDIDAAYEPGDHPIVNGAQNVANYLQRNAGDARVLLGHVVTKVTYGGSGSTSIGSVSPRDSALSTAAALSDDDASKLSWVSGGSNGVVVETSHGEFACDYLVITVPLNILRDDDITFDPPLPTRKRNAIQRLRMGLLDKVILEFDDVFWDREAGFIGFLGHSMGEFPFFYSLYRDTKQPIIVCFLHEPFAHHVKGMTDEQLVDQCVSVLAKFTRVAAKERLVRSLCTHWRKDPFARGSYSYVPVGGCYADYDIIAEPHQQLLFAGEATSRQWNGTIHGAFLSGQREAQRIVDLTRAERAATCVSLDSSEELSALRKCMGSPPSLSI